LKSEISEILERKACFSLFSRYKNMEPLPLYIKKR
jgi:hypothetical protein